LAAIPFVISLRDLCALEAAVETGADLLGLMEAWANEDPPSGLAGVLSRHARRASPVPRRLMEAGEDTPRSIEHLAAPQLESRDPSDD
jgi:hypothetical protein